jgi:hypothetical protein
MPHGIEGLPPIFARLDRSLVPDLQDQPREPVIADAVEEKSDHLADGVVSRDAHSRASAPRT